MLDLCQFEHRREVDRSFLEMCSDPADLFQPADAAFDDVAMTAGTVLEVRRSGGWSAVRFDFSGTTAVMQWSRSHDRCLTDVHNPPGLDPLANDPYIMTPICGVHRQATTVSMA